MARVPGIIFILGELRGPIRNDILAAENNRVDRINAKRAGYLCV